MGARTVGLGELFLGYLKIGLFGFGGVAPYARHVIVEERRWLTDQEFAELLGLGQILPGPNTVNTAIFIGDRFQGARGVLVCLAGLMAVPLVVVTLFSLVYDQLADRPIGDAALLGGAAAGAGLMLGTGLKMASKARLQLWSCIVILAAVAAVGPLRWPLIPVVLVLAPVSIALASLEKRP